MVVFSLLDRLQPDTFTLQIVYQWNCFVQYFTYILHGIMQFQLKEKKKKKQKICVHTNSKGEVAEIK